MVNKVYYANSLQHHGILGQKWGVRRFQNSDGTYTEEGKARRREDNYSNDYKKHRELSKKSPRELSTKEIEELNRRDNAMSQYNKNHASAGKQWFDKYKESFIQKSAQAAAASTVAIGLAFLALKYPDIPWTRK